MNTGGETVFFNFKLITMIIYRAMVTPDGTILQSTHVHDFVGHDDKNGNYYAIDGGLSYCKITAMDTDYRIVTVDDSENWEVVRQFAYRLTALASGTRKTILAKMSDDYLKNAIEYANHHNQTGSLALLKKEKAFRKKWKINVNEQGELH